MILYKLFAISGVFGYNDKWSFAIKMGDKMKEIRIDTWPDLIRNFDTILKGKDDAENNNKRYNLLFRGHASDDWKLKSTLERKVIELPSCESYASELRSIRSAFESYYGLTMDKSKYLPISDNHTAPQDYELMVLLRHHGYPTPILDWTRSPYIATFFAFQNVYVNSEEDVAIIVLEEPYCDDSDFICLEEPHIISCGPTINTHIRHGNQQAEYTYCRVKKDGVWCYSRHIDAVNFNKYVMKYILPASLKNEIHAELDTMGINIDTLYGQNKVFSKCK